MLSKNRSKLCATKWKDGTIAISFSSAAHRLLTFTDCSYVWIGCVLLIWIVIQLQATWRWALMWQRAEDNSHVRESLWFSPVKWMDHLLWCGKAQASVQIPLPIQQVLKSPPPMKDLYFLLLSQALKEMVQTETSHPPSKWMHLMTLLYSVVISSKSLGKQILQFQVGAIAKSCNQEL